MDKDDQIKRLADILQEKGVLISGEKVQTIGLRMQMEVLGFIPCSSDDFLFLQFNADFIVGNDKIRIKCFTGTNRKISDLMLPVTRRVERSDEKQSFVVDKFLNMYDFPNKNILLGKYMSTPNMELPIGFYSKDEHLTYVPQVGDYIFYHTQEAPEMARGILTFKTISVAKTFYCLCAYLNDVTGKIDHYIYSPYDLVIIPNVLK